MKRLINLLVLLVSIVLLQWLQQEHISIFNHAGKFSEQAEQKLLTNLNSYELSASFPGKVSSAENCIHHSRANNSFERDENEARRKQQQTFEALAESIFTYAKYFALNTNISAKRQPYYSCIFTENRQLRI